MTPSSPKPLIELDEKQVRDSRKMSLTLKALDKVEATGKRFRLTDTKIQGLSLEVSPEGRKTWQVRVPSGVGTRQAWISIGPFPGVTPKKAREIAKAHVGKMASNPEAVKEIKAKRGEETLSKLVDVWLESFIKVERQPGTYVTYACMMKTYVLPAFGLRYLKEITPDALTKWREKLIKRQIATAADSALRTLSSFFRWAIRKGKATTNPARDVPREGTRTIHRPLNADARRKVGQTIQEMMRNREANPIYLQAVLLAIATGIRRRSLAEMAWKDINFEAGTVVVRDKSVRKTGPKTLPLGPVSLAILRGIPRIESSPWVFPGADPSEHVTPQALTWNWGKVRVRAGVHAETPEEDRYHRPIAKPSIRFHDLRHTKGSVLGQDHQNTMVAATLALSTVAMADRYGKPVKDEVRRANLGAEQLLGEDLGIYVEDRSPGVTEGYGREGMARPQPTPIVITIQWPFAAGQKPKRATREKKSKGAKGPQTKAHWPSEEELRRMVMEQPVTEIAKALGVSDKAVEKRCKRLKIEKPGRGYWARKRATD